ncbi:MAG: SGNH/GDSL hydrolase family protein [Deltaproteobacteria bacterium]|nr:SGNH/GDSL hydrolase family protein [Deltaproteobacteria bacterium]
MLKNWGLRGTLQKKFNAAGAKYFSQAESGYNSRSWIVTGKLGKALKTSRPDIVLINLGTNAVKAKHPENYAIWIKKLVNKIKPRKCYWISPPGLIEDKYGFYDVLAKSIEPCELLDSRQAHFQRPRPKVFHLTRTQSIEWADMIWDWINRQQGNIAEHNDTDKADDTDEPDDTDETDNVDKTRYGF